MPVLSRKNIIVLTDTKLASFHRQLGNEIARRTKAATSGQGPAAIVKGQEMAKRAVIVAAAGNHSLHIFGPPNVGKTMLRAVALKLGLANTYESRPCLCGYRTDPRRNCKCTIRQVEQHIAGFPAVDITVEAPPVPEKELSGKLPGTMLADMREQIDSMTQHESLDLDENSRNLLKAAVAELGIDAAGRETIIQIARTIANLDGRECIEASYICEAINYRPIPSIV